MSDRVDRNTMWNRMRRNFIKWWRVFYIPIQRLTQKNSPKVEREEYIEQQQAKMEEAQAAARQQTISNLTEKAEAGVAKKSEEQKQVQAAPVPEPPQEEERDLLTEDDSTLTADELAAKEILARLKAEADSDAAKKQAEIDAARAHVENSADSAYNATTKSFSGNYGKGPMDAATKDAVSGILSQNNNDMQSLIEQLQQDK